MELSNILNELEELIEGSMRVPLTRKVLLDEDRLLDCIDRIRTSIPEEMRQAKWLIQEREKVLADSKREASRIIEDAKKQMDRHAEESEITRQAKIIAEEMIQKAEQVAFEIKQGARDYADDVLSGIEKDLEKLTDQVKKGRAELNGIKQAD